MASIIGNKAAGQHTLSWWLSTTESYDAWGQLLSDSVKEAWRGHNLHFQALKSIYILMFKQNVWKWIEGFCVFQKVRESDEGNSKKEFEKVNENQFLVSLLKFQIIL